VIGGFLLFLGLSSAAIVGPWLWRNVMLYDQVSLNMFQNRTLLIYKTMHSSFDKRLPVVKRESALLGRDSVDYDWLGKLGERYGTIGAERVASELLREQWRRHPGRQLKDVLKSFACFGGWYEHCDDDRAPIRYWFENLVGDVAAVDRLHEQSRPLAERLGFTYVTTRGDSIWTRAWQKSGWTYLVVLRPILFVGFFIALALPRLRRWPKPSAFHEAATRFLSLGYLATAAFHSVTLTDSDRFSSLYDWMGLLVILLMVERWRVSVARTKSLGVVLPR
jgi:hypothetical protein